MSVCGTVNSRLKLRGFSWKQGIAHFRQASPPYVITPRLRSPDLPRNHAYTLEPGRPTPGRANLLRPPIASRIGTGILTCFPSTTPFGLALRADSPCADERGAGNLGLSASGPFTRFIATHVSIRTSDGSSKPLDSPSQPYGTLSYHPGTRIQRTDVRNSVELFPTSDDALQHLCNLLIFVAPTLPRGSIDVSEIMAVATPNTHLIGRPHAHLDEAFEFGD